MRILMPRSASGPSPTCARSWITRQPRRRSTRCAYIEVRARMVSCVHRRAAVLLIDRRGSSTSGAATGEHLCCWRSCARQERSFSCGDHHSAYSQRGRMRSLRARHSADLGRARRRANLRAKGAECVAYIAVSSWLSVVRIGVPASSQMTMPFTPLWLLIRFSVSSTSLMRPCEGRRRGPAEAVLRTRSMQLNGGKCAIFPHFFYRLRFLDPCRAIVEPHGYGSFRRRSQTRARSPRSRAA